MKKFPETIYSKTKFSSGWLLTLFAVSIFLPAQRVEARKFFGLKVHGDHRVLEPIISEIPHNRSGVTREDVLNRVRQILWESGIKPDRPRYNSHFLEVDLVIHSKGTNFSVEISLKKMAQAYGYDPSRVGTVIKLPQGRYGVFGNAHKDKDYILDAVEDVLEDFIADYKDSNLF
jgi:hypothetical protein